MPSSVAHMKFRLTFASTLGGGISMPGGIFVGLCLCVRVSVCVSASVCVCVRICVSLPVCGALFALQIQKGNTICNCVYCAYQL